MGRILFFSSSCSMASVKRDLPPAVSPPCKRSASNNLAVGRNDPPLGMILIGHGPVFPGIYCQQAPIFSMTSDEIGVYLEERISLARAMYGDKRVSSSKYLRWNTQGQVGHLRGGMHRGQNLKKNEPVILEIARQLHKQHGMALQVVCQEGRSTPQIRYSGPVVSYLQDCGMSMDSLSNVFQNSMSLIPPSLLGIHRVVWPTGVNHIGVVKTLLVNSKGVGVSEDDLLTKRAGFELNGYSAELLQAYNTAVLDILGHWLWMYQSLFRFCEWKSPQDARRSADMFVNAVAVPMFRSLFLSHASFGGSMVALLKSTEAPLAYMEDPVEVAPAMERTYAMFPLITCLLSTSFAISPNPYDSLQDLHNDVHLFFSIANQMDMQKAAASGKDKILDLKIEMVSIHKAVMTQRWVLPLMEGRAFGPFGYDVDASVIAQQMVREDGLDENVTTTYVHCGTAEDDFGMDTIGVRHKTEQAASDNFELLVKLNHSAGDCVPVLKGSPVSQELLTKIYSECTQIQFLQFTLKGIDENLQKKAFALNPTEDSVVRLIDSRNKMCLCILKALINELKLAIGRPFHIGTVFLFLEVISDMSEEFDDEAALALNMKSGILVSVQSPVSIRGDPVPSWKRILTAFRTKMSIPFTTLFCGPGHMDSSLLVYHIPLLKALKTTMESSL